MIVGMIQNRDTNLFRQLRNPNRREYIPLSGGSRTPTNTQALLGRFKRVERLDGFQAILPCGHVPIAACVPESAHWRTAQQASLPTSDRPGAGDFVDTVWLVVGFVAQEEQSETGSEIETCQD